MINSGRDLPTFFSVEFGPTQWWRAAKLVTPIVVFGITLRSIWQRRTVLGDQGFLTTSDLIGWDSPFTVWPTPFTGDFPYGLDVLPD